jgi:hypothetical protein
VPPGGSERGVGHSETLSSLWVAQVLQFSTDMVAGVCASVCILDVDH